MLLRLIAPSLLPTLLSLQAAAPPSLNAILEPIRAKYNVPALAGAIFTTDGIVEIGAIGVRKRGDATPVTVGDLWHLGSDTKAMTATLAGTFVAEKKLAWDAKVLSFFPGIRDKVPPATRIITVADLLTHRAGLPNSIQLAMPPNWNLPQQRVAAAEGALQSPAHPPGSYHYSNFDYITVAAILEKISGESWEDLMRPRLFVPLGMTSAGFGGLGTPGKIDQPWPHDPSGAPEPMNGPATDLPELVGPAGTVHCTMTDWAKFLADQLRGGAGMKALLPGSIYRQMQTAVPGFDVGFGWGVMKQPWSSDKVLTHAGSNDMNYCLCILSPAQKFGVLVCTNQGGADSAGKAVDEAAHALILRYLGAAAARP